MLTPDDPEHGIVITDKEGRISRFLENPAGGSFHDTVNTGSILEPALRYIPEGQKFDFSRDLFPLLLAEKKALFGCALPGYWCDIGSLEQYLQAQYDMLSGKVTVEIPAAEREKGIWISPDVQVEEGARLQPPLFVGPGTRICAGAKVGELAVIGAQNCIGPGAVVTRGITWDGVQLAAGAALKGGILGQKVLLEERAVVYEEAVVADKCMLGEECVIKPGVKVWPHKRVAGGLYCIKPGMGQQELSLPVWLRRKVKGKLNGELSVESAVSLCCLGLCWDGGKGRWWAVKRAARPTC